MPAVALQSTRVPRLKGAKTVLYIGFACNGIRYPDLEVLSGHRVKSATSTRSVKAFIAKLRKHLRNG